MLSEAWELLDAGDLDAARTAARAALATDGEADDRAEAELIIAQVDFMQDRLEEARVALAALAPALAADGELLTDAGNLGFALADMTLAASLFDRALAVDDSIPDAAYGRGLVAQASGDFHSQVRWFQRALVLDANDADPPWAMTVDEFAETAEAVLDMLPATIISHLENVPIIVEMAPSEALVADGVDPRLLGLFSGIPLTEKSIVEPGQPHLDAIHLYQRNLERHCENREHLESEIAITVLHETAHFFGLEDHHLDDIGLG